MKKTIQIVFEVPEILLEALWNKQVLTSANGVTTYAIKVDTDKKQTLLDMCLTESAKQEMLDLKTKKQLNG
jgi:hypothetical protein